MSNTRDGDLAAQVSRQVQREHVDKVIFSGEEVVDLESPMVRETRRSIFAKIEFRWRASDEKILDQIRAGVDAMFGHMYSDMKHIVDAFYAEMRVPVVDPESGVVKTDSRGRVQFQKDSSGKDVEDWSQMTGQDIESALLNIERLKLDLAPRVNALLNEAVFARHIADDSFHDSYLELVEGTVGDRNAHASQKSREDKYQAFYRYYLWSNAESFMKEMSNFTRVLERVRYWRIDDGGKKTP
jgi:hypothetical protein